ncbi:hypothetical protein, unlikely [Trypanosoma brucei gambiense DAL972]|uniref:T. brucei spp.-specific protein n=1 Tax=Trypanosoma brucei gambiense (strain MHOM/CI/86/DAL972) TaxID=679716 RepID=C9ZI83_TRYB9|nr:hypothetical protein, unlikely [Trypanosoma brucei gambiense DAL972]CBH08875.1 hypothetical protein, unlikely [Trypanosoma brucei gambiense DAL972]|eukprot:XP_011771316.1 hypothetical protein, unlikely [Trypanosoma brucei gambiense DAL972]
MFQPLCFFFTFFFFSSVVKFVCWTRGKNKVRYLSVRLFPSGFVFSHCHFLPCFHYCSCKHIIFYTHTKRKRKMEKRETKQKREAAATYSSVYPCAVPPPLNLNHLLHWRVNGM